MSGPLVWQPVLILGLAVSSLFVGSIMLYAAIKAPFFWGGLFYPGMAFMVVFVASAMVGTIWLLRGN